MWEECGGVDGMNVLWRCGIWGVVLFLEFGKFVYVYFWVEGGYVVVVVVGKGVVVCGDME